VPRSRQYRKRHLMSVAQLLRMIDAVLTMAPEFSDDSTVMLPLGAILDWTMATPAGFAAYRDPRVNAALQRVLSAYLEDTWAWWDKTGFGPDLVCGSLRGHLMLRSR